MRIIAVAGLVIAGVLALWYFISKKVEAIPEAPALGISPREEPIPLVEPYPEELEDWRSNMWEEMRYIHWSGWTEEQWQSLKLEYGDPGYQEAFIKHYGQDAWDELMAKREAYEEQQAKRKAAKEEMDTFLDDILKPNYTMEDIKGGIPQSYFTDLYGPAWVDTPATLEGQIARQTAMREYFLEHHPNVPLPKELEASYITTETVWEPITTAPNSIVNVPEPELPIDSVIVTPPLVIPDPVEPIKYKVTFTDGSSGYFTAGQITDMQDRYRYDLPYNLKHVAW